MARKKLYRTTMKVRVPPEIMKYLGERAELALTSKNSEAVRAITERMRSERRKANRVRASERA
jgi:hypothetical protein